MACSALESLPTELLILITDNLPSGYDVFQLRHVSKTLYQILSSHDVVSHALQTHYPLSLEALYPPPERDRRTFDAVVRRSFTQPRRKSPRLISGLMCFPLFCSEADQVLAYQTATQKCRYEWECTLRDLVDDSEVIVKVKQTVGGCYGEDGAPYRLASVRNVWCEMGRGVMIVGGKHTHINTWTNFPGGPFAGKVDLGDHGIQVASRGCNYEHTFIQIYSLHPPTLGNLVSYFSFYGATVFTHSSANRFFFAGLSSDSLFLLPLSSAPIDQGEFPPLSELCRMDTKQAKWRDFVNTALATTTALTVDSLGKALFVYIYSGWEEASVVVVSALDGSTLKEVSLGDSFSFEYQLNGSPLWRIRFEQKIKSVRREMPVTCAPSSAVSTDSSRENMMLDIGSTEGEEVSVTWLSSYGIYGKHGTRISAEGPDHNYWLAGQRTPVMIEWRITPFPLGSSTSSTPLPTTMVIPTLYFSPSECLTSPSPLPLSPPPPSPASSGIMGVESSTASFEEIHQLDELVRWSVPVCLYLDVADKTKAVTVFLKRSKGLVDERGSRYLFPRWKMVLELSSVGPVDNSFFYEGVGWLLVRIPEPVMGQEGNKLAIIRF